MGTCESASKLVKFCSRCKETKPRSEFSPRLKIDPNGPVVAHCKPCAASISNEWYHLNKEKAKVWRQNNWRRQHLEYTYGITEEEYLEILRKQNNVCAICKNVCSSGKNLAVDHDHKTRIVRGLLCEKCNHGLGKFNDDIQILSRAIEYLGGDFPLE